MIIAPSILSMDFSRVEESMDAVNASKAQWIHFDVMDGHFVPNITFGPDIMRGIKKCTPLFIDAHLMISNPKQYAEAFIKNGADQITFHYECFEDIEEMSRFIDELHQQGVKVGITSKPKTDISTYYDILSKVDLVLVMSVEPGFGGQSFMMESLDKIKAFKQLRETNSFNYLIQVDGGINQDTVKLVKDAGCDVVVAGSYIFKGDIVAQVESLCQ